MKGIGMDFKYTNDGKKVVVVGKLNNQETIVQEIFIVDGNEIPSGENFVVKSLHDAPAVSWQQKEIEKIKNSYEVAKKNYEQELSRATDVRKRARAIYEACAAIINNANPEMFDAIANMIGGEYRFALSHSWYGTKILPIENYIVHKDGYDHELRLISIFGKSDGDFSWGINRYRDDSGGWETFFPCKTKEQAIQKAVELIEAQVYTQNSIDFLKEYSLPINAEKLSAFIRGKEQTITVQIEETQKKLDSLKESLIDIAKTAEVQA